MRVRPLRARPRDGRARLGAAPGPGDAGHGSIRAAGAQARRSTDQPTSAPIGDPETARSQNDRSIFARLRRVPRPSSAPRYVVVRPARAGRARRRWICRRRPDDRDPDPARARRVPRPVRARRRREASRPPSAGGRGRRCSSELDVARGGGGTRRTATAPERVPAAPAIDPASGHARMSAGSRPSAARWPSARREQADTAQTLASGRHSGPMTST